MMKLFELISRYDNLNRNGKIRFPYIIAEAGVNHEANLDFAKRLIDEACEGGADAIKFQTYRAGTIASKDSPSYWDTKKESAKNQQELFKRYDKFWKKEFEQLKLYCDSAKIEFLSTPFDLESALFLNDLMGVFKISSSDITNKPFIEYICKFNKPIILSTGASYLYEIMEAVSWIEKNKNPLTLMHCVLNYPTKEEDANLGMIVHLQEVFQNHIIGYSDHTQPDNMKVLEVATILGALILEKHFTFDKTFPGNDHYHAMDKVDLIKFKRNLTKTLKIVGLLKKESIPSEEPSRQNARRSLVAKNAIPKGKIIQGQDLTWKRPATGICPRFIDDVIGKKANTAIEEDTILKWYHIY
jgi:sialic acid synthase SpsE